ncbi:MAG TPA: hypothetical protein VKP64_00100 [Mycobacteriales bacterium]|nr:hypothetical protein [Mycobacteriales bacterium]
MTSREVLELLLVRTYAEADALQAEAESAREHGAVRAAKLRAVRAAHLRAQARDIGGAPQLTTDAVTSRRAAPASGISS